MDGLPEAAVCDVWQIGKTQTQDPREAGRNKQSAFDNKIWQKKNTKEQKLNNAQTKKRNDQIKRWRSSLEKHEEQKPDNKPWEKRRHRSREQTDC